MNRQESINNICNYLALFVQQIKTHNAVGAFDINRFSEHVLIPVLSEAYDFRGLVNLNLKIDNFPGIDLADETNRIAFQITSNSKSDKIKETLRIFIEEQYYEKFDRLIIYDITEKKKFHSGSESLNTKKNGFSFSRKDDVWDYSDLLRQINTLTLKEIRIIEEILDREFRSGRIADDSLSHFRNLSRIVSSDANFVAKENDSEENIFLGDGLYVTRTLENKIAAILSEQESPLILISGEAGRGKTSLLWNLFNSLRQYLKNEVWFLKSTMLKSENLWGGNFNTVQIAIEKSRERNKRPILLLDTIDLLLHEEHSRDLFIGFLLNISEIRCTVIATSRPQELFKLSALNYRKVTLLDYEASEFEEAVHKHVARFYSASARQEKDNYAEKILEAVARGLPVREVCINPLTLRMLFTIYAPAQIQNDINIFNLYKEYWTNRVEKDVRAGSLIYQPTSGETEENLGEIASKIAVIMLAEGLPELKYRFLLDKLGDRNIVRREVETLISRDIIHRSEDETITFFHQTFFEHCAARGLLYFLKEQSVELLRKRIESEPDDLFTTPIFEQTLLLAEDDSPKLIGMADDNLLKLLQSKNIFGVRSGLYVYCHRQKVKTEIDQLLAQILINSDEATQIRFLELSPNTPAARLDTLFNSLDLMWAIASERVREHILNLLVRLTPRNHHAVKAFFDTHNLFDYLQELKEYSNVARNILQIIQSVSFHDPIWGWKNLIRLCEVLTRLTKGRELITAIIDFLRDEAYLFNPAEIASKFENDTKSVRLDDARNFEELSQSYGNLWFTEWKARKASVVNIMREIEIQPEGIGTSARMKGFGQIISFSSNEDAILALTKYDAEQSPYLRSLWREAVFPNWLGFQSDDDSVDLESKNALRLYLKRNISSISMNTSADSVNKNKKINDLVHSIMLSRLTAGEFLEIVDRKSFVTEASWLNRELLGPLFVHGIIAEHPGALRAADILITSPEPFWSKLAGVVGMKMIHRLQESDRLADIFFKIVIKAKDSRLILRAIETVPLNEEVFSDWKDEILHFSRSLIMSPNNPSERRNGLLILHRLLKQGQEPPFEIEEFIELLKKEAKNHQNQSKIISIISHSIGTKKFSLDKVFDELCYFAKFGNEELRRAGMYALVKVTMESEQQIPDYIGNVVDAALVPPLNAERITSLRPLIERLLPRDVRLAANILQKLLIVGSTLGNNGKHKIFGRLKPMARAIVKFADDETRRELLNLAPDLDRILACMVVDAICHEALFSLSTELDKTLELNIPGEIKETIIKYRYTQEREFGGKQWHQLYDVFEKKINTFEG